MLFDPLRVEVEGIENLGVRAEEDRRAGAARVCADCFEPGLRFSPRILLPIRLAVAPDRGDKFGRERVDGGPSVLLAVEVIGATR